MSQENDDHPRWDYLGESSSSMPDDPAGGRQREILEHPETREYLTEMYERLRRFAD